MLLDCVGIGVGPFNLSLACLAERVPEIKAVFLEERRKFTWHSGMQLPDARIQVSHFKDLVTLSDPTNPYTFVSYLQEKGRLYHFLNARFDAVLRQEFEAYLAWAFDKNTLVRPDHAVIGVTFENDFSVASSKGQFWTKNLSVGVGRIPNLPGCVKGLDNVGLLHTSDYRSHSLSTCGKSICVVGGGQSGAEVFLDLLSRPPDERPARISWISRRANFEPLDDSPFANELFTPHFSNIHFKLDKLSKQNVLKQFKLASDGISEATLAQVYQALYRLRFVEESEVETQLISNAMLIGCAKRTDGAHALSFRTNAQGVVFDEIADIVIFATGYRPRPLTILGDIASRFEMSCGEPRIREDFSVVWDGPKDRKIFLVNSSPFQRGIADPNLSLNAWRSETILASLCGYEAPARREAPGFVNWNHNTSEEPLRPFRPLKTFGE